MICWTQEIDDLLGTVPDKKIADRFGMSTSSVCGRRKDLGIKSCGRNKGVVWTCEMDDLLGTIPDRKLARRLGLSKQTVMYRRRLLGIPSHRKLHRIIPEGMPWWASEAARIYQARRKHREVESANTLTYEQWLFACSWFKNSCAYCGEKVFLTEDHLVPVSRKGPRTISNIVPACQPCNSSKRDRLAHIWIYEHFGARAGKRLVERIVMYLSDVSD